jgi:hypothetical protein
MRTVSLLIGIMAVSFGAMLLDVDGQLEMWQAIALLALGVALIRLGTR